MGRHCILQAWCVQKVVTVKTKKGNAMCEARACDAPLHLVAPPFCSYARLLLFLRSEANSQTGETACPMSSSVNLTRAFQITVKCSPPPRFSNWALCLGNKILLPPARHLKRRDEEPPGYLGAAATTWVLMSARPKGDKRVVENVELSKTFKCQ